jgi:O-antigen/teichoic acid export membrane protein
MIRSGAIVILLIARQLTPATAAEALLLSPLPLVIWFLAWRLPRANEPATIEPDRVPWGAAVRLSLGCVTGVLATMSAARLDQVIGLPLIGARQLGLYAVAVSIAELGMIISMAARPMVLALDGRKERSRERYEAILRNSVISTIGVNAAIIIASGIWLVSVFGSDFRGSIAPTVTLSMASIVNVYATLGSAWLICLDDAVGQSLALIIGAFINIGALLLLSRYGAEGAAIASVFGYGVSSAIVSFRLRRVRNAFPIPNTQSERGATISG